MSRVVFADIFPPALLELLRSLLPPTVDLEMVASPSDDDFARVAADAEVIVCAFRRIDGPLLDLAPNVRFVQQYGIGFDNLDLAAIAARGIGAAYNPGFNRVSTAEHTVLLMLAVLRRFHLAESLTRQGGFPQMAFVTEHQPRMAELGSTTVGLVGFGTIGQAVAERLSGFGTDVVYTARRRREAEVEKRLGARYAPFPDLLSSCDLVSLHVPLNAETRHLMGDTEFALMPAGSLLVNTSRGSLVDEAALRRALERGHLAGAALDVLEDEAAGANPFADLPQVIVTPHYGGASQQSMPTAIRMCAANITRFLRGETPENPVPGSL